MVWRFFAGLILDFSKWYNNFFKSDLSETEIKALEKVTSEIKKPITCIIGGSKISTKIGMIKNLIPKFDNIIIVGGMANNILDYLGNPIGKSIKEDNCKSIIDDIFKIAKTNSSFWQFGVTIKIL